MFDRDVVVVGAGVAGLTAAYRLRKQNVEVLDADSHVGGRTLSEQFPDGGWANFAAQYLSPDKINVLELAQELELTLLPVEFPEAELRGMSGTTPDELEDIRHAVARLEAESANPRPATAEELDDVSLAQYLRDEPRHVRGYFEHWCASLMCASSAETSVYGALMLWGDQRTSAFNNVVVPRSNRGDCVFDGGTNQLTLALAKKSAASIHLDTEVVSVRPAHGGYQVIAKCANRERRITARQVVCALPATVAAEVCMQLPDWKRDALSSVQYGRFLSTPIGITAHKAAGTTYTRTWCRPGQVYNSNNFALRTPGDIERSGGCFHSYIYDMYARQVWDDPEHTVKTGAADALLDRYPQFEGRIRSVGYKRWRYGLPRYAPGRMKLQSALERSVDGIHFCGDYIFHANSDGAVRSANRAAESVMA